MKTSMLLILALSVHAERSAAQAHPRMDGALLDKEGCARCALHLERMVVAGSASDAELIPDSYTLTRMPDGRLIVGSQRSGLLLKFDAAGRYSGTLGVLGEGPGEYRNANGLLPGPGDSVTILGANINAVISMQTGRGRSSPKTTSVQPTAIIQLTDGSTIVNNHYPAQPAFLRFNAAFKQIGQFGPSLRKHPDSVDNVEKMIFRIAPSATGGFWAAAQYYEHRIERWSATGQREQIVAPPSPWWINYDAAEERRHDRDPYAAPMNPVGIAIHESQDGRLWVINWVPNPAWRRDPNAPRPTAGPDGAGIPSVAYRPPSGSPPASISVVEVYDAKTTKRIASWRLEKPFTGILPNGDFYRMVSSEDGIHSIEVWHPTMTSGN